MRFLKIFLTLALFSSPVFAQQNKAENNGNKDLRASQKQKNTSKTTQKKNTKSEKKSISNQTQNKEKDTLKNNKPETQKTSEETSEAKSETISEPKTTTKSKLNISQKLWIGFTAEDVEDLKKTAVAIQNKNFDQALKSAEEMKNRHKDNKKASLSEALIDVVLWKKYSDKIDPKKISFSDISRFANDNPYFPNINEIRRNVERVAIANNVSYQASEQYFINNPAETKESRLYLLNSKIDAIARNKISENQKENERKEIRNLLVNIWIKDNFSQSEEEEFLSKFRNQLSEEDHINRIRRLLWDNKNDDAERIMNLVSEDHQILFNTIIELEKNPPKTIDTSIRKIAWNLRSDELLTYRKIMWHRAKDKIDDVIEFMLDLPNESKYPEKWWSLRKLYGREMIKQKKYRAAYKLFSEHNLPKKSADFWEAEWTSGWIALRFLDNAKDGYVHFGNVYKNSVQPVTLSRASYWLGMAAESAGDKDQAVEWYKNGAKYPIFFYGQLSIHKHRILDPLGAQSDIILPKDPEITAQDIAKMSRSQAAQVAFLLSITGDKATGSKIFEWIVNNAKTDGEIGVVMYLVNEIGDRQIDARISRVAARRNVFFIRDKFQIVREVSSDEYAPLVHAIIKQESGFAPTAVSHVGAIGFMQLMPDTARLVAKEMGIPYNKTKLAQDIEYNIRLGSFYIKKLINRFEGSEMMAIAAYNAGPNAVQRWVNEFYDPRKEQDVDKVIDWIELITYSETRNYVQRIMENLIVYKYLMSRTNYDSVK